MIANNYNHKMGITTLHLTPCLAMDNLVCTKILAIHFKFLTDEINNYGWLFSQ